MSRPLWIIVIITNNQKVGDFLYYIFFLVLQFVQNILFSLNIKDCEFAQIKRNYRN